MVAGLAANGEAARRVFAKLLATGGTPDGQFVASDNDAIRVIQLFWRLDVFAHGPDCKPTLNLPLAPEIHAILYGWTLVHDGDMWLKTKK